MAVPKSKVSKSRRDKRRSSHWKLTPPTLVACSHCGEPHVPHRVCRSCGYYNGKEILKLEEQAA
ncbi:MAG: 50S ribosomal protein L32 [Oscillospiraceae bacterium]|nr:50S ribosomal protein L32 [Oscillospiraceae bacterium]